MQFYEIDITWQLTRAFDFFMLCLTVMGFAPSL